MILFPLACLPEKCHFVQYLHSQKEEFLSAESSKTEADMSHVMRKPVLDICEQQRCRSACLISTFVVRNLDCIKPLLAKSKISRLASLCSWASQFESYLVGNPEDKFSRDKAHMVLCLLKSLLVACRICVSYTWDFRDGFICIIIEPRHEKTCLCHIRTTKAQISLRICAVWSAPLLFTA